MVLNHAVGQIGVLINLEQGWFDVYFLDLFSLQIDLTC